MKHIKKFNESKEDGSECSNPECDNIITDWSSGKCPVCGEEAIKPKPKKEKPKSRNIEAIEYYLSRLLMIEHELDRASERDVDRYLDLRIHTVKILTDLGCKDSEYREFRRDYYNRGGGRGYYSYGDY
jgi:hypothetical protein